MSFVKTGLFSLVFLVAISVSADVSLPVGSAPQPLELTHFPSRMHAFIWRNWPVVEAERLADVLQTDAASVQAVAESMGLPPQEPVDPYNRNRIYITLIRRNWHLLPYEQLLQLLLFTPEELAHSLQEDDFLYIKLGSLKPNCEPLLYTTPTPEQQQRCAEIKALVEAQFGDALQEPAEPRFHFLKDLNQVQPQTAKPHSGGGRFSPRYIYSYCALYGDPLLNDDLDSYPEGLLQQLAAIGVDGLWVHTVLRQLAPSPLFPEFGEGHEIRLKNLRKLVERARRYGLGIFLYVNEPRSMPDAFFTTRQDIRGVPIAGQYCMCTSTPLVRQWLADSLAYVFTEVPGLAGAFTITASENPTNCASHGQQANCPRCKDRTPAEIIAEVNATVAEGVHRGNPDATVIAWDWGWNNAWAPDAIARLPKSVRLMSVSEWDLPIERGGIKTSVGEYSLSAVGPGPRAIAHWGAAKKAGLKTMAKMQINCTWELSAVPYLPVLDLIADHCSRLLAQDVDGLMLSWTLGGYPSPNLALIQQFDQPTPPTKEAALDALALEWFGPQGAPLARKAWTCFSEAFQNYPYHGGVVYTCPAQYGPSNLLYPKKTGYAATMVGIPYDDVDRWRGPYPVEIFAQQFALIAEGWNQGIETLRQAVQAAPADRQQAGIEQLRFAEAAQLHFASVANQTTFTRLRNTLLDEKNALEQDQRSAIQDQMKEILRDEIRIARRLFSLTSEDSRIGFEASNQYYYLPVDLMEKTIDCQSILDRMDEFYP
ncbi:MAG: hypothetical protein RBU29_10295 [bacterium]|nr:hypothetical protein [bacterium]